MLDERPILQKSLIGAGAFAFVFTAAMGGTAFMISGGIGLGGDRHDRAQPAPAMSAVQDTWSEWTAPAAEARIVPASLSQRTPDQPWVDPPPASTSAQNLDGSAPQQQAAATTRSEDWVTQNAPVQYAQTDDDQTTSDDSDKTKDDSGF